MIVLLVIKTYLQNYQKKRVSMSDWKIYTKKGDKGQTSLIGGLRVDKDDVRIEAYGTIDELNAFVGNAYDLSNDSSIRSSLLKVMNDLFIIESLLAWDNNTPLTYHLPSISDEDVEFLEKQIDQWNDQLPSLANFILPAGCTLSSALHIARTVCRRGERLCISLKKKAFVDDLILRYLNRLSDFLFVAARFANAKMGADEVVWIGKK